MGTAKQASDRACPISFELQLFGLPDSSIFRCTKTSFDDKACAIRNQYTLCGVNVSLSNTTTGADYTTRDIANYLAMQTSVSAFDIVVAIVNRIKVPTTLVSTDPSFVCVNVTADIRAEAAGLCEEGSNSFNFDQAFDESINEALTIQQLMLLALGVILLIVVIAFFTTVGIVCAIRKRSNLQGGWNGLPKRTRVATKTKSGSLPLSVVFPTTPNESKYGPVDDPYSIETPPQPRPGLSTPVPDTNASAPAGSIT